ncbi:MAG: ATP-binding protein [Candidatus Cloacimonetes bacterium]|nr:ATP-binding protein [Candidatus Cloacimonadota bacterium]
MDNFVVKRDILPSILSHLAKEEITVIVGPRQAGKTTLLLQVKDNLKQRGVSEKQIFFFNLDLVTDLQVLQSQEEFIRFIKARLDQDRLYFLIDEVQRMDEPGRFFKGIYDLKLNVKFILTGSSSLFLRARFKEPLTGRKRVFYLYPFSFREYLRGVAPEAEKLLGESELSLVDKEKLLARFKDFCLYGGYPAVSLEQNLSEKVQILKEIYSSYIEKDIVGLLQIQNQLEFSRFVSLIATQIGQLVNVNELANTLKLTRKTIESFLDALELTFVVKRAPPFFRNYRKEITKMPKVYFLDTGLRNLGIDSFLEFGKRGDKGVLLENAVFAEIFKAVEKKIYFWRTRDKSEVDFVFLGSEQEIIPIEVKATALSVPQLARSFRNFIEHYQPKRAFVVNFGLEKEIKMGRTTVSFILPFKLKGIFKV